LSEHKPITIRRKDSTGSLLTGAFQIFAGVIANAASSGFVQLGRMKQSPMMNRDRFIRLSRFTGFLPAMMQRSEIRPF
jgi:hypothetical protein